MPGTEALLFPCQAKFVQDRYPVKVVEKSRQIGFSWTVAFQAVCTALMRNRDVYYMGYNLSMSSAFIADCAYWADIFDAGMTDMGFDNEVYDGAEGHGVFTYKITFANGHEIKALASNPMNLRSKHGSVILDEAAYHPDLDGARKSAIAHLMWMGDVTVVSTHDGVTNPFNEWITEIRSGKEDGRVHRVTFQDALGEGLYKRICDRNGVAYHPDDEPSWVQAMYKRYGENAEEELDVVPGKGSGGYLAVSAIERAMENSEPWLVRLALEDKFMALNDRDREFEMMQWFSQEVAPLIDKLPKDHRYFVGLDFARSGDKTVFAPMYETEYVTYRIPFLVELHNVPFEEQLLLFLWLVDMLPRVMRICVDAGGNGAWLAERAKMKIGGIVEGVHATDKDYRTYMPRLRAAFQNDHLEVPRHTDVLQDLRLISVVKGVPKIPKDAKHKGTDGLSRHGDTAMAIYMAYRAKEVGSGGYATSNKPPSADQIRRRARAIWEMR